MITATVKYNDNYTDIEFPCSEAYLSAKLMEIHVDDLSSTTRYISAITEPKELSFLKDKMINLDELNYLAKRMDSFFGDEETQFFEAIKLEHFTEMKDLINLTFNLDKYTLIKDVSDMGKVGREYLLNTEGCIPAHDEDNPKYAQIGRELLRSGRGIFTEHGLLFPDQNRPFEELYNGKTFPAYIYDQCLFVGEIEYSENKEVIYTVRCAECGDRLIHRTDNSRKNTDSWYCKNKDCKTVIRKTVAVLEDEITELLNSVIQNPDLAGKEYISSKNETPIEIKRMENEIERALGQIDFDKETIQNLILQCASKRYEKEKSQKHITDRLKADFEKSSPLSVFDAEFFSKTVTAVLLTKNGSVSLLLKNGNIIGKEKNKDVNASSDNA